MSDAESHLRREIGIRITILSRLLRQDFDRRIDEQGVTRSQWALIVVVARHPGATQREIAKALQMSEASAGRLVDRLCADGLLERRECENDRRARVVFLTDKSRPMLEELGEVARESEARVFRDFTNEELEALRSGLDKLYFNVAGAPCPKVD